MEENIMKRHLDEEELKATRRGMSFLEKENKWLEYQLEYFNLMLDKGLEMNLLRKRQEFEIEKAKYENNLEVNIKNIRILKDQIRNGVEIKEKKEENEETK
jgi:hypothetical protein